MPMLMTLRMRLPVWPVQAPLRTWVAKAAILSSTACTSGTTSWPSTRMRWLARRAQGHVQHGPPLGDVDLLAAEHGVDAGAQPHRLGQADEQAKGLVGHAVLGVVEVETDRLRGEPLAALGILGEERRAGARRGSSGRAPRGACHSGRWVSGARRRPRR